MGPSFNPAVEAQAIGRVHRVGQKRKVEVIRLVTKKFGETRILEMLKKKYGNSEGEKGATAQALVGNIQFDKTKVLSEEFDILYGLTKPVADSDGDMLMQEVTSTRI
jgi:SNF2 family DNA or RNA helicase